MSKYNKDFIQYSDRKVKDETKNLTLYFIVHITLYLVLFFFLIFFIWYTIFVSTHKFYGVSGPSMKSTLNSEISDTDTTSTYDAVYVDLLTEARLFDIVVVERPKTTSIIKRVMAQEGDYITIAKSKNEDYFYFYRIAKGTDLTDFDDETAKLDESTGENEYRINGYDDWYQSRESTSDISVQVDGQNFSNIYEKNFYNTFLQNYGNESTNYDYFVSNSGLIYIQVPEGQFFYMGDNRGHSTDARVNGFCDTKYIVGRTEFIVYNYNFTNRLWEVVKFYFSEMDKFFIR